MCYDDMCSLHVDDMWDLFESLAWYQWHGNASESFVHHFPFPYHLHAQSLCVDQFRIHFITFPFILLLCGCTADLLTMIQILVPITIFLMHAILVLMP